MRIEDTDRERLVEGGTESTIKLLQNVGMHYNEGPVLRGNQIEQVGDFGPYIQSLRLSIYKPFVEQLLTSGHAYYCFCSADELASQRKEQELLKQPTKYNRRCLNLSKEEIDRRLALNEGHVVRMKIPEGETSFTDIIRGEITISNSEIDDQVLMKSDGFPTYHMANVVDDHLMEITHVIRGEEWISSTTKHILLYKMLGWSVPEFAHCPLLLNADHSKLSKRQGDVAAEDFLAKGYLPEALLNFLCLLGYNPKGDQEIYTMQEMIELFDLSKVNPSGAVVNFEKLDWMNGMYLRKKSAQELVALCQPFLDRSGISVALDLLERIVEVEKGRMTRLAEIVEIVGPYIEEPLYDPQLLVWKKADAADAKANLIEGRKILDAQPSENWTARLLEQALKEYTERTGTPNGNILWPLRVALSGRSQSAGPFELAWVLGKTETLARIDRAIQHLS